MPEIDLKHMQELVALMVDNDLTELQYEHGELKIELKRGQNHALVTGAVAPVVEPLASAAAPAPEAPAADDHAGLTPITSPMVGTFYSSPDPESPAFISVGTTLGPDSTVCLIEAMKVFNEIKAEVSGTVEKILVQNADAVEYGQVLFYVRPH